MEKCKKNNFEVFRVTFSKYGVKFEHTFPKMDQATQLNAVQCGSGSATLIVGVTEPIPVLYLYNDCSSFHFFLD
jgi:hypothetical protein